MLDVDFKTGQCSVCGYVPYVYDKGNIVIDQHKYWPQIDGMCARCYTKKYPEAESEIFDCVFGDEEPCECGILDKPSVSISFPLYYYLVQHKVYLNFIDITLDRPVLDVLIYDPHKANWFPATFLDETLKFINNENVVKQYVAARLNAFYNRDYETWMETITRFLGGKSG